MDTPTANKATPLNVLILEDRRTDAELLLYELRQAGFALTATCVATEQDFVAHLSPQLDVILADYNLPGFDAPRALDCLRTSGLEIPLIIVSGTVGEETALAAMRLGAADYILKDRLLRLGSAVREAIEKCRLRRERLAVDQAICNREKWFRALIEHSTDGILVLSAEGEIQYASPSAGRILGVPVETLVGQNALQFVGGKAAGTFARRLKKLAEQPDGSVTAKFRCRRDRDRDLWVEATVRNLYQDPAVGGIVVNFRDITTRVDNEQQLVLRAQQLVAKNEQLARNSRRLEELNAAAHQNIANVSHDFRTPLTVLSEYCSLLREGEGGALTPQQLELANVMATRIDDLALMVENMLDSSASEAGIMLTFRRVCSLQELCQTIPTLLERRAAAKRVALDFQIPADIPPVYCDSEKLQRVIVNLAVNALKFTPPDGMVRLWARSQPRMSQVVVGISDNGPGIPPKDLDVIFGRFQKLGNTTDTTGFGLGLNITADFVRMNLGTIHVSSVLGKGSTFSFTIPFATPDIAFARFLDYLQTLPEPPRQLSLLDVRTNDEQIRVRKTDLVHLLRLRLHGTEMAYPIGESAWCVAVPFGEGEAAGFADSLRREWGHFRKNCPARELPDLAVRFLGAWSCCDNRTALEGEFSSRVGLQNRPRWNTQAGLSLIAASADPGRTFQEQ